MTSDAKIGLLLGLVFIFVIAFIINGLPNLKPQTSKAVTPNMVSVPDDGLGITRRTTEAHEALDWSALTDWETAEETPEVAESAEPVVQEPEPLPEPAQTQVADDQGVRSEFPIPSISSIDALLDRVVAGLQREPLETVDMDVPASAVVSERPAVAGTPRLQPAPEPPTTVTAVPEVREPSRTTSMLNKLVGKIYVVEDGDNLGSIAKKVYGLEEGNRVVNINRIFEANKELLKSKHEVFVGQKLVIPPLPAAPAGTSGPGDVLPKELFERVQALGRGTQPTASSSPARPVQKWQGRWYTVVDGDNLWKIASSQLGAGARYEEIRKLNADVLNNGDSLDVGMKLRLPAK